MAKLFEKRGKEGKGNGKLAWIVRPTSKMQSLSRSRNASKPFLEM